MMKGTHTTGWTAHACKLRLIPRSTVLSEKLIIRSTNQDVPRFYVTITFITVFTITHHWTISWATWIQSTRSHSEPLRSMLILLSRPQLYLTIGFFPHPITEHESVYQYVRWRINVAGDNINRQMKVALLVLITHVRDQIYIWKPSSSFVLGATRL
jgi:hypothetical protein